MSRFYKYEMRDLLNVKEIVFFPISEQDFDSMVVQYREFYDIRYRGAFQEFINKDSGIVEFRRWYSYLPEVFVYGRSYK